MMFRPAAEGDAMELLISAKAIKKVLPYIQLHSVNITQILTGKPLMKEDIERLPEEEIFAAFLKDRFIGVYRKVQEGDILAKAEFVYT